MLLIVLIIFVYLLVIMVIFDFLGLICFIFLSIASIGRFLIICLMRRLPGIASFMTISLSLLILCLFHSHRFLISSWL